MRRQPFLPFTESSRPGLRQPVINIVSRVLVGVLLFSTLGWAQSACDVTNDGTVNAADLDALVSMVMGSSQCASGIQAIGGCNAIAVQRVVNAVTVGACSTAATGTSHSVGVSWVASVTANVIGYNLYRSASVGGTYTLVNSALISGTSYTDSSVQAGQTYYYVATAVDSGSNESQFSTPVSATIPAP
jgi:hypothetical protein